MIKFSFMTKKSFIFGLAALACGIIGILSLTDEVSAQPPIQEPDSRCCVIITPGSIYTAHNPLVLMKDVNDCDRVLGC